MMKRSSPLLLAALVVALAGCSSTRTEVDHGPIKATTFNFVNRGTQPVPAYADNRQAVHPPIQDAITKNLASRGLRRVPDGGDVTVAYLIIVGNNATTTTINDYFGYHADTAALHDKAHSAYIKNKNPNYFEAGTLLIDLIETKSYKLLKRGHATRPILRDVTADARAARIQEAVDEILRDVRFVP